VLALPSALERLVARQAQGGPSLRIDCALVPFLSTRFDDLEALRKLGVMGCEAGGALAAVKVDGRLAPCSFASAIDVDARATSALRGAFVAPPPELARWRTVADAPPEPCASCAIRAVCRGGCKIVSAHLGDDPFAPDPECPRVRAHAGAPA
jgi:radical SAM protein with 4Fe4S-binding SPASM domain